MHLHQIKRRWINIFVDLQKKKMYQIKNLIAIDYILWYDLKIDNYQIENNTENTRNTVLLW